MGNTLEYLLKLSNGGFINPLRQARDEQGRFIAQGKGIGNNAGQVNILGGSFARLVPLIVGAGAALATATGLGAAFAVKTAAAAEQSLIQFETLTGSMEQAKATLAELTALGASTPFELPQLTEAAKKLLAARVPTTALKSELTALGNVSSATGADLGMLATVYGQMAGKGKIYAEDLQQFVEAGAGEIKQSLAESLNVSTAGLNDLMTAGKVGFSDMQKALQGLAGTSGKWSESMQKQSQTTIGLFSTLKDNIGQIFRALGQPLNDGPVKSFLQRLVAMTGTMGAVISNAIQRGQVGETLKNALSLGAKLGINATIGFIETLPARCEAVFVRIGQSLKAALMGQFDFAKELLGSINMGKMRFDTSKEEAFFKTLTQGANEAAEGMKDAVGWAEKLDATAKAADTAEKETARSGSAPDEKNGRKKVKGFSYKASGANSGFGSLDDFANLQEKKETRATDPNKAGYKRGAFTHVNAAFKDGAYKMPKEITDAKTPGEVTTPGGMKKRMMGGNDDFFNGVKRPPIIAPKVAPPGAAKNTQTRQAAAVAAAASQKGSHPLAALIKSLDDKLGKIAVA